MPCITEIVDILAHGLAHLYKAQREGRVCDADNDTFAKLRHGNYQSIVSWAIEVDAVMSVYRFKIDESHPWDEIMRISKQYAEGELPPPVFLSPQQSVGGFCHLLSVSPLVCFLTKMWQQRYGHISSDVTTNDCYRAALFEIKLKFWAEKQGIPIWKNQSEVYTINPLIPLLTKDSGERSCLQEACCQLNNLKHRKGKVFNVNKCNYGIALIDSHLGAI